MVWAGPMRYRLQVELLGQEGRIFTTLSCGQETLSGIFDGEFIGFFVQWSDEHGLWVSRDEQPDGTITVVLIRWDCFVTAMLDWYQRLLSCRGR